MRLATYNVEWFDELFDRADRLIRDDHPSRRYKVTRARQADSVAAAMQAVDPDLIAIIEAPNQSARSGRSTVAALEGFAAVYGLRPRRALLGFGSETHQEIALLFDPDVVEVWHDPLGEPLSAEMAERLPAFRFDQLSAPSGGPDAMLGRPFPGAPRFDSVFPCDVVGDGRPEMIAFSKPPLEAGVRSLRDDRRFRVIAAHLKSKNPGRSPDPAERARQALRNRIKHLGQCLWLRARIEEHLTVGEPVVALGDLNDGPGLDAFEARLGRSGLETVVGTGAGALVCALINPDAGEDRPATARFWRADLNAYAEALLDFALLSPDLAASTAARWRVWHPFNEPTVASQPALQAALLDASDHFPVSVDLGLR